MVARRPLVITVNRLFWASDPKLHYLLHCRLMYVLLIRVVVLLLSLEIALD